MQFYLASASPRRQQLLQQVGYRFAVRPANIDETPHPGESPSDYVLRLARQKALAAMQQGASNPALPVLAADTSVSVDDTILGKAETPTEAAQMLRQLSGRWHLVHTAVAVSTQGKTEVMLSSSRVEFAQLGEADIHWYLASGEYRDKAGAYAIQGGAALFIRRLEGSYSGVMGLPLYETAQLLAQFGVQC